LGTLLKSNSSLDTGGQSARLNGDARRRKANSEYTNREVLTRKERIGLDTRDCGFR